MFFEILCLFTSMALTVTCSKIIDPIGRRVLKANKPLPDVMHWLLPDIKDFESWVDAIPLIPAIASLFYLSTTELSHLISCHALMLLCRCIAFSVTILPSPVCTSTSFVPMAIGGCHDCIFSGHSASTVLTLARLASIPGSTSSFIQLCILYTFSGALFILATRSHYTIDVLFGVIMALLIHTHF